MLDPVHAVISGRVVAVGVRVNTQSPVFDPVFCVLTVITPVVLTESDATYVVASVEQPDTSVLAGQLPLVDTYSLTDVLHAANAAVPSDIFERIT